MIVCRKLTLLFRFSEHAFHKLKLEAFSEYQLFDYEAAKGQTLPNILTSLIACDNEDLRIARAQLVYLIYYVSLFCRIFSKKYVIQAMVWEISVMYKLS